MKNISLIIITFSTFSFSVKSYAQANLQTLNTRTVFSSEATFLNPSYLKNTRGFQLHFAPFLGINARVGNNFVSAGNIIDYSKMFDANAEINFEPIHAFIDNLRPNNSITTAVDLTLLHANFRIGKPNRSMNFGLSVRQHANANFTINDDFFRLAYGGNKQFAGKTVYLYPKVSALAYTDIGLAASKTLKFGKFSITPSFRYRYLIGNAAGYTDDSKIGFYTEADGEYVQLSGNLDAYAGGIDFENEDIEEMDFKTILKGMGRGSAIDLGLAIEYKNMSLNVASIDNGSIKFKQENSKHYFSSQTVQWDGYDVVAAYEGTDTAANIFDEVDIQEENKAFKTGIGSKFTFNFNYGMKSKTDKKGYQFYKHNFGLSGIKGFADRYNASKTLMYAIYYQLNLGNRLTTGINFNSQGNITDLGFNLGLRLGAVNMGLGSNSLIGLLDKDYSRQVDLMLFMGFNF